MDPVKIGLAGDGDRYCRAPLFAAADVLEAVSTERSTTVRPGAER